MTLPVPGTSRPSIHRRWAALILRPEGEAPGELVAALNDPERRDEILKRVGDAHHHTKWAKRYELVLEELEEG